MLSLPSIRDNCTAFVNKFAKFFYVIFPIFDMRNLIFFFFDMSTVHICASPINLAKAVGDTTSLIRLLWKNYSTSTIEPGRRIQAACNSQFQKMWARNINVFKFAKRKLSVFFGECSPQVFSRSGYLYIE